MSNENKSANKPVLTIEEALAKLDELYLQSEEQRRRLKRKVAEIRFLKETPGSN